MPSFHTQRRVEFRDTDAAGIMHFSVFFAWMESCEHEMLRDTGMSVMMADEDYVLGWPRVSATCDFKSPVRFEDVVDVQVRVKNVGNKSATYSVEFSHDGKEVAVGEIVAVCCEVRENKPPKAIAIPDEIREKLAQYS